MTLGHAARGRTSLGWAWWVLPALVSTGVGAAVANGHAALAAALVFGAVASLLVAAHPERAAVVLLAVLPFFVYPAAVSGYSLFVGLPLFLAVAVALTLRLPASRDQPRPELPRVAFAVAAAFALTSTLVAENPVQASARLLYLLSFAFLASALARTLLGGRLTPALLTRAIVLSVAVGSTAVLGQFLAQLFVGQDRVLAWLRSVLPLFGGQRAAEISVSNWIVLKLEIVRGVFPFMAAPSAGQYLMVGFLVCVAVASSPSLRPYSRSPLGVWIAAALAAAGLLSTLSRQAWMGALAGLCVMAVKKRSRRFLVLLAVLLAAVAFVPIPGSGQSFGNQLLTAGDLSHPSNESRLELWRAAVGYVGDHLLVGVGPNQYYSLDPKGEDVYYAHNLALDAAVELGLIGGIALVLAIAGVARAAARNSPLLALPAIAAFAVANMFDDALYLPRNGYLLAAIVAIASVPRAAQRRAGAEAGDRAP